MKKTKKLTALFMAAFLTTSMFVACGGNNGGTSGGNGNSGNKTILKVGVTNAGTGYRWAELVEAEFEKQYANVSFEEGKMGVDVKINPQKTQFTPTTIDTAIKNEQNAEDIYFTVYNCSKELATKGSAANIDDIMYEKAYTTDGEIAPYDSATKQYVGATISLYDKMFEVHQESHNLNLANGIKGFYSIPYEDHLSGFIYDYDLFKEKGWLDYDGIDGLPDNEKDFFDLFDRIVDANMLPYTTGNVSWYMQEGFQDAFYAQYEGYDEAALCYTYDGEYTFKKSDLPTDIVESVKNEEWFEETADGYKVRIDGRNAWILVYQPSKNAYANFIRKLTSTQYFDEKFYLETYSHTEAQQNFILSKLGKEGQKRIAMIQEGEWWENEGRDNFTYTGGFGKRDFRFFPLPAIEGQKDSSVRSLGNYSRGTDIIVNAKTKKMDLCRLFLQFVHSESSLETFTMETNTTRFFHYDLSEEQLQKLTPFGRNVYKIKMTDTSGITIFTAKDESECHPFFEAGGEMTMGGMGAYTRAYDKNNKVIWEDTFTAMLNRSGAAGTGSTKISAEDYIDGMRRYFNKAAWETAYDNFAK